MPPSQKITEFLLLFCIAAENKKVTGYILIHFDCLARRTTGLAFGRAAALYIWGGGLKKYFFSGNSVRVSSIKMFGRFI